MHKQAFKKAITKTRQQIRDNIAGNIDNMTSTLMSTALSQTFFPDKESLIKQLLPLLPAASEIVFPVLSIKDIIIKVPHVYTPCIAIVDSEGDEVCTPSTPTQPRTAFGDSVARYSAALQ